MNAAFPSFMYNDPKLLEPKAQAAWRALEGRYSGQVSTEEIDYLYALYVLGLTTPFFGDHEPTAHLDACRTLLLRSLTPERIENALCMVPKPSHEGVQKAFVSIEQLGIRDGQSLLEQLRNPLISNNDMTSSPAARASDGGSN
ncbi:hypothetical protein [Agrobacterium sp. LMR679]|uniref:hypothetical protein n=1 Tax=Agrobacterium sp. LMR679 TaxID=3014335 RepID=UPI0022AEF760|nr:hypothetical protein [Agrobacterium sp. LMR679]MCZ4072110.1 hypothetical protein [Agrobacterium sp. LMR679]